MKHKNEQLLSRMAVKDKIELGCGTNFWHSAALKKYGIPAITAADGPHGLRFQTGKADMLGVREAVAATCFPAAVSTGSSWDRELVGEVAAAIATEARAYGVDILLGPGLNMKRNPLCGRNFEYFSEDPYLTGQLGSSFVSNAQKKGTGVCIKHFACNSQEYKRFCSNGHIDERTLREIYLSAFETAVKEGRPRMVMSAYNKINGIYCSDNRWLLTTLLREEWGFEGVVVTDWGGMHDRIRAYEAGCDWSMPGGSHHLQRQAMRAYRKGKLTEAAIDASADRLLSCTFQAEKVREKKERVSYTEHHLLAKRAAVESAVLLKNDGLLPLQAKRVALIGHMAKYPRYQGAGSSRIRPTKLSSLAETAPDWIYAEGCNAYGEVTEGSLEAALQAARQAEAVVIAAGLPAGYESEGFDRDSMQMPQGMNRLIEAVATVNPNTAVVLLCGSPVELPWLDCVKAVLYMGLPGQAGGEAALDLLMGNADPCGALAESWPIRYEDVPSSGYYGRPYQDAQYREALYVGYRYYTSAGVPVQFPFGFGLSYTSFAYSKLQVSEHCAEVTVTNTGDRAGKTVVQLYIEPKTKSVYRPLRELKGFQKVSLEPGESKVVCFPLTHRSFAIWQDGWKVPSGDYEIQIGRSCCEICESAMIFITGQKLEETEHSKDSWYAHPAGQPSKEALESLLGHPIKEPEPAVRGKFTPENTIMEMKEHSRLIGIGYRLMEGIIGRVTCGSVDYRDPEFRMSLYSAADSTVLALLINAAGALPERVAYGMVDLANGHYLRALGKLLFGAK